MKLNPFQSLPSKISLCLAGNHRSILNLVKDENVEGRVVKSLDSGNVLLLIKGKIVTAKSFIPMDPGKVVLLKVQEIHPVPMLRLLGIKPGIFENVNFSRVILALKENLWQSVFEHINERGLEEESLSRLNTIVDELTRKPFLKYNPKLLRTLIKKSGVTWEAKLRKAIMAKDLGPDRLKKLITGDLKGQVSEIISFSSEKDDLLRRFLSTLDYIQLLNHTEPNQDRKIFLPISMQFPTGFFALGQLLIHLPRQWKEESEQGNSHKNSFRVTFLLELSNLGPLRADLFIKEKKIGGKFTMAKEEAKLIIEKSLPMFINSIKERGFLVDSMECHLQDPEIVTESLIKEIIHKNDHNINLVA